MIFQDPYASLNPRMWVADIMAEPLASTGWPRAVTGHGARGRAAAGSRPAPEHLPLSARVLRRAATAYRHRPGAGARPSFIVADEPVCALDMRIQAQIVNLLVALQQELGAAYIFIAHDLAVVRYISHDVAVMYLGRWWSATNGCAVPLAGASVHAGAAGRGARSPTQRQRPSVAGSSSLATSPARRTRRLAAASGPGASCGSDSGTLRSAAPPSPNSSCRLLVIGLRATSPTPPNQ